MMLRDEVVPAGTRLAYKILPGSCLADVVDGERFTYGEQGPSDWSALYAQFSVAHAVSYLPNHWDRGSARARRVGLTPTADVRALPVEGAPALGDPGVDSAAKAGLVRRAIRDELSVELEAHAPLVEAVGRRLGALLVLLDAEELECAIPHSLASTSNFGFTVLATLERDAERPWATRGAAVGGARLACSKRECEDVRALGRRLAGEVDSSGWRVTWRGAACHESEERRSSVERPGEG